MKLFDDLIRILIKAENSAKNTKGTEECQNECKRDRDDKLSGMVQNEKYDAAGSRHGSRRPGSTDTAAGVNSATDACAARQE